MALKIYLCPNLSMSDGTPPEYISAHIFTHSNLVLVRSFFSAAGVDVNASHAFLHDGSL